MLLGPLTWSYRRLGPRYLATALAVLVQFGHLVVLGGVGLLSLFVEGQNADLLRVLVAAQILVAVDNGLALARMSALLRPARPWLEGDRTPETAVRAWRSIAALPLDFVRTGHGLPVVLNVVPISVYAVLELDTPLWPGLPILLAGSTVVLLYGILLRFFAIELVSAPVLADISRDVPASALVGHGTIPLRARLLLALPAINIVTGVVVSALASGEDGLGALGLGVVVSIAVAFTVSLELSLLLARSIVGPLGEVREGMRRAARGDYAIRVPVVGTDEIGQVAAGFNELVGGLDERERLREAFGAYVDPAITERVMAEGTELAGEEVEVTVLFVDIRDFTPFAETASAREVVATLNAFYEQVVPVLVRHGGHVSKFVGDGLLAVFGAPDRLSDHADRAVAAALELARCVEATWGGELRVGIGVNSGPVVAGTVGGGGRVEFTVIGDVVNTAARVEGATRSTGDVILVTEATRRGLTRDHGGFEERVGIELKGKRQLVRLHAALAARPAAAA